MSNIYQTKSTFTSLIFRGMFSHLYRPWRIEINLNNKIVRITKRNWYLIGVDEDTFQFSSVRHVKIDKFLFGADVHIKMYGGTASIFAISKKSAKKISNMLLNI